MRKTTITLALVFGLVLPASAETDDYQVVEISHEELDWAQGSIIHHRVDSRSGNLEDIATAINGYFLWVELLGGETVSVDVSDLSITKAIVHLDGTVELIRETPSEDPVEEVDLIETYPGIDWGHLFHLLKHA